MDKLEPFRKLDDTHLLSILIYGEARGENLVGKIAVGYVVLNRVKDKRWPDTVQEVVLQKLQFSCFNEADPNFPKLLELAKIRRTDNKDIIWRECQLAAYAVICGWCRDPTQGANHYNTLACDPKWDDKMKLTVCIEDHEFFKA